MTRVGGGKRLPSSILVLVLVAVACGSDSSRTPSGSEETVERGEAALLSNGEDRAYFFGDVDVRGEQEAEVVANYAPDPSVYYFSPTVIVGEPGQVLRLRVRNKAFQAHTFTLDEQGIDRQISPRSTEVIEVVFPQDGGITFYCAFHFGSSNFQAGELRVR
ncbi:MAG: hypothetical protein ACRDKT_00420 [Actinomycetota bacterium]